MIITNKPQTSKHSCKSTNQGIKLQLALSHNSGKQCLIKVRLLSRSQEEIARELIHTLSMEYSIVTNNLLAAMTDQASSNGVAMKTVNLADIGCFSHMIDRV